MLRHIHGAAILASILLLNGCAQKSYQITTEPNVPSEIADAVKGKTFKPGRNLLVEVDKGKLFADIEDGRIASLTLEVQDKKPQTVIIARMPDPKPTGPIETPQGCDQAYDSCLAACGADHCCRLQCFVNWVTCTNEPGHPPGLGIVMM